MRSPTARSHASPSRRGHKQSQKIISLSSHLISFSTKPSSPCLSSECNLMSPARDIESFYSVTMLGLMSSFQVRLFTRKTPYTIIVQALMIVLRNCVPLHGTAGFTATGRTELEASLKEGGVSSLEYECNFLRCTAGSRYKTTF